MSAKETYTITSDVGITLAIVPKDFIEQYQKNIYSLLCDGDRPEKSIIDNIEKETHIKLDSDEAVIKVGQFYNKRGFIGISDYIIYRMSEYIRTTLPICRNCGNYMNGACGYCHAVGSPVQETCTACEHFFIR